MKNCPKCGSTIVYMGFYTVECGEKTTCPNWTQKQANEVVRIKKEEEEKKKSEIEDLGLPDYDGFDDDSYYDYFNYCKD